MKTLKITEKDGRVIEVSDLSFQELRELIGSTGNGHDHAQIHEVPSLAVETKSPFAERKPEYSKFKQGLSAYAKKFFIVLSENPDGIGADELASRIGFKSTNQIGGVTGGGIGKMAGKNNIEQTNLYSKEVLRMNGQRVVVYRPGPDIFKVL